jgi:hypothetical protein
LGISARKITISTVGLVNGIRKLMNDPDMPPVRLAVSLHCATDEERSALLPANRRNGGLAELMTTLHEYIQVTGRRVTLEWALIAGENDTPHTARTLGRLIQKYQLRPDLVHVNVIPLNPTAQYGGKPSAARTVSAFCAVLSDEFGVSCTPRVRRGIDIDAGCGQLTTALLQQEPVVPEIDQSSVNNSVDSTDSKTSNASFDGGAPSRPTIASDRQSAFSSPFVATALDGNDDKSDDSRTTFSDHHQPAAEQEKEQLDFDSDEFENPELESLAEKHEANRLVALVQGTTINMAALETLNSNGKVAAVAAPQSSKTGIRSKKKALL